MVKITFIQPDNSEQVVECEPEMTLMEAARLHNVPGIEAECGGACACATCHVYVDEAWRDRTGTPSQMEEDMLDFAFDVRDFEPAVLPDQGEARARRPDRARSSEAVLMRARGGRAIP